MSLYVSATKKIRDFLKVSVKVPFILVSIFLLSPLYILAAIIIETYLYLTDTHLGEFLESVNLSREYVLIAATGIFVLDLLTLTLWLSLGPTIPIVSTGIYLLWVLLRLIPAELELEDSP